MEPSQNKIPIVFSEPPGHIHQRNSMSTEKKFRVPLKSQLLVAHFQDGRHIHHSNHVGSHLGDYWIDFHDFCVAFRVHDGADSNWEASNTIGDQDNTIQEHLKDSWFENLRISLYIHFWWTLRANTCQIIKLLWLANWVWNPDVHVSQHQTSNLWKLNFNILNKSMITGTRREIITLYTYTLYSVHTNNYMLSV